MGLSNSQEESISHKRESLIIFKVTEIKKKVYRVD